MMDVARSPKKRDRLTQGHAEALNPARKPKKGPPSDDRISIRLEFKADVNLSRRTPEAINHHVSPRRVNFLLRYRIGGNVGHVRH